MTEEEKEEEKEQGFFGVGISGAKFFSLQLRSEELKIISCQKEFDPGIDVIRSAAHEVFLWHFFHALTLGKLVEVSSHLREVVGNPNIRFFPPFLPLAESAGF